MSATDAAKAAKREGKANRKQAPSRCAGTDVGCSLAVNKQISRVEVGEMAPSHHSGAAKGSKRAINKEGNPQV